MRILVAVLLLLLFVTSGGRVAVSHYAFNLRLLADCSPGDPGLRPGSGRSPREGNDNLFQYSCLENSMDRGAWQATVMESQRVG